MSAQRRQLDERIRGWEWVTTELARARESIRLECDRLLGPNRGE